MSNVTIDKIKEEFISLSSAKTAPEIDEGSGKLVRLLTDLNENSQFQDIANDALFAICETIGKEVVECVEEHKAVALKDDPVREIILQSKITRAICQIRTDLIVILNK